MRPITALSYAPLIAAGVFGVALLAAFVTWQPWWVSAAVLVPAFLLVLALLARSSGVCRRRLEADAQFCLRAEAPESLLYRYALDSGAELPSVLAHAAARYVKAHLELGENFGIALRAPLQPAEGAHQFDALIRDPTTRTTYAVEFKARPLLASDVAHFRHLSELLRERNPQLAAIVLVSSRPVSPKVRQQALAAGLTVLTLPLTLLHGLG